MTDRRFLAVLAVLAAAVFLGVRASLREGERAVREQSARVTEPARIPGPAPIGEIARSLRAMKLVTVEIQTQVESVRVDGSWRGDVAASVVAPARLLYGCDLSGIAGPVSKDGAENARGRAVLLPNMLTGGYTLRVPRPMRIATEVEGDRESAKVDVGWGRFRDVAGEYQLGLARAGLYPMARSLRLSDQQAAEVEQTTREQLVALVRGLSGLGSAARVQVEFFDANPEGVAGIDGDAP